MQDIERVEVVRKTEQNRNRGENGNGDFVYCNKKVHVCEECFFEVIGGFDTDG